MAIHHFRPQETSFWSGRTLEWVVAGIVVLALGGVLLHRLRMVQGQVELASIQSTLGALRTALVLEHMHHQQGTAGTSTRTATPNPFELLERIPINYQGVTTDLPQAVAQPAGSWFFDSTCVCVGYKPRDAEWLVSADGAIIAWYQVQKDAQHGPSQLVTKEAYLWQGTLLK